MTVEREVPRALTVAGSDSGGGAGVVADLKTFESHGVWGLVALAAVTAQDTTGVHSREWVTPALVTAQIEAVAGDIGVDAAKTGMLADAEVVAAVARTVRDLHITPLVVDPVMVSKHDDLLLARRAVEVLAQDLVPQAALVTPNLSEAAALSGLDVVSDRAGMEEAGRRILGLGAGAVLVKGGHLVDERAADCFVTADGIEWMEAERIPGRHTHGTGCVLSAAVTARLARGDPLAEAVSGAKVFVTEAIGRGLELGSGIGPVNPGSVLGAGPA